MRAVPCFVARRTSFASAPRLVLAPGVVGHGPRALTRIDVERGRLVAVDVVSARDRRPVELGVADGGRWGAPGQLRRRGTVVVHRIPQAVPCPLSRVPCPSQAGVRGVEGALDALLQQRVYG